MNAAILEQVDALIIMKVWVKNEKQKLSFYNS